MNSPDTEVLRPYPKLPWREVNKEIVIVDTRLRKILTLKGTSVDIWKLLCKGMRIKGIAEKLTEIYEIDPATAYKDVRRVVSSLVRMGLVESRKSPAYKT